MHPHFLRNLLAIAVLSVASITGLMAQGSSEYGSGLKFNLNPEGTKYARIIMWNQMWFRSMQMNPGTSVNGTPTERVTDIGARRLRILAYAQITPRYLILTHIGINNQTFLNGGAAGTSGTGGYGQGKKPGLFFHDVWNEYAVVPAGKKAMVPLPKTPSISEPVYTTGTAFRG